MHSRDKEGVRIEKMLAFSYFDWSLSDQRPFLRSSQETFAIRRRCRT